MSQLSTLVISYGKYYNNNLKKNTEIIPNNIRLFVYDFNDIDYDNYYLLHTYNKNLKILFFINKKTGKIFKKELTYKEYSPNDKITNNIILSFNNIKHMMNISSFIIHPNGFKQDFHNNGLNDSVIIYISEFLKQLSKKYSKLFPNEIIEVHLSNHKNGIWNNEKKDKKIILYDNPDKFTIEEIQNMQNMLLNEFIVINQYPQAKYVTKLIKKKLPINTVIKKTRTYFNKYRNFDKNFKTYKNINSLINNED